MAIDALDHCANCGKTGAPAVWEPSCNPVVDGRDGRRKRPGYEWYMVAVVEVSSFAILLVHACVRCAPSAKLLTIVVQHSVLTSEKS